MAKGVGVNTVILCSLPTCTAPQAHTCLRCGKRLCTVHFTGGTSSHCGECFKADVEHYDAQRGVQAS